MEDFNFTFLVQKYKGRLPPNSAQDKMNILFLSAAAQDMSFGLDLIHH